MLEAFLSIPRLVPDEMAVKLAIGAIVLALSLLFTVALYFSAMAVAGLLDRLSQDEQETRDDR